MSVLPNEIIQRIALFINNRTLMAFRQMNKWTFANISVDDFMKDHLVRTSTFASITISDYLGILRHCLVDRLKYAFFYEYGIIHRYLPIRITTVCRKDRTGKMVIEVDDHELNIQILVKHINRYNTHEGEDMIEFYWTDDTDNIQDYVWVLQFIEKYFNDLYEFIIQDCIIINR